LIISEAKNIEWKLKQLDFSDSIITEWPMTNSFLGTNIQEKGIQVDQKIYQGLVGSLLIKVSIIYPAFV
jgi:hypothetical protein